MRTAASSRCRERVQYIILDVDRSFSARRTGGEALALQLEREGITHVFGVPGYQLDWAVDGLARLGGTVRFYTTRHEQAATYMADGYARVTGRPGVAMVVPGPGLLNAAAGLATAYACSSPVVCIAGQIPSATIGRGLGMLHEIPHQTRVLHGLTKWHQFIERPEDVPSAIHGAVTEARSGRPRPTGVEIPPDVLMASTEIALAAPAERDPLRLPPEESALDAAAALLGQASLPAIYAGWGVQTADATSELVRLAEHLGAPVVMSEHGRGAISDAHPLALTSLAGRAILPHADAVLVVGSRFIAGDGTPVAVGARTRLAFLNADSADLGPPRRADVAMLGDARAGLSALADRVRRTPQVSRRLALDRVRAWCAIHIARIEPQLAFVEALRAAIPDDGVLVTDLTQVSYLAQVAYRVYEPRTFLTPGYQGTLGYGFATALGASAADDHRPVVAIAGDGGFGWALAELATARLHGLPVVTVVFNDNAYGNVKRGQQVRFGGRMLGSELVNPDFVGLAEAFGVDAVRAASPGALEGALRSAIAARRPAVIEVPVGAMPSCWHLIHEFLPQQPPDPPSPFEASSGPSALS